MKNNIKNLGVSLANLYKAKKQLIVHLSDRSYTINVMLNSSYLGDKEIIDCKLSSFEANLWTRTRNGVNGKKYKTIRGLQKAIKGNIQANWETEGEIKYSLTDEVLTF